MPVVDPGIRYERCNTKTITVCVKDVFYVIAIVLAVSLDVIFSTDHESHTVTGVYHTSLSDHYMIYTVYDRVRIIHDSNNKILMFRNYKKFSSELFIKDILACDCIYDTSWDSSLLEAKWDEFKNVFITVSDIHAPLHCRKLKNRCNPWFDNDILEMIYRRDYVKRKAISYNDAALWQTYNSKKYGHIYCTTQKEIVL